MPTYPSLVEALREFVLATSTQSQLHIRPVHCYVALRLVIEGGFLPDEVTPHPPLKVRVSGSRKLLIYDSSVENDAEQTVLGGLKTKNVDVVVAKQIAGPVVAVSVKGTGNAFRNLTNRMEEAIGDSTNLHIMYPGLVYGFLHLLRANRAGTADLHANDMAVSENGEVVPAIRRYHDVLLGLAGRRLVRDDYTRYEAVSLTLVEAQGDAAGQPTAQFPPADSPLHLARFFDTLYAVYDLRFPYIAASVPSLRRQEWDIDSPALMGLGSPDDLVERLGYRPRLA
jgi:hypothetical protein